MPEPGTLHDLYTGKPLAEVADVEAAFLEFVRAEAEHGPRYVVVGTGSPESFLDRVREIAPVVIDPSIGESAAIMAGHPEEWTISEGG
jgi:hypothetical protein